MKKIICFLLLVVGVISSALSKNSTELTPPCEFFISDTVSTCSSYVSPSGNYTWMTTGIYGDTIFNGSCDTIFVINLSINDTMVSFTEIVCDSLISPSGKIWKNSGLFLDTLPNSKGCDSLMTFNLTVNNSSEVIIVDTVCDSLISPSGKIWNTSGIYNDTISNSFGCDSLMTFDLIFKYSSSVSYSQTVCDSMISPSGKTWSLTGIFMDTIANLNGCDSLITVNLTVNNSSVTNFNDTVCDSLVSPSGLVWDTSGVYSDTLLSVNGCDSIVIFDLVIENPVPTSSIIPSSGIVCSGDSVVVTANCTSGTLVWYSDSLATGSPTYTGQHPTIYTSIPISYTLYAFCEGTSGCLSPVNKVEYTVSSVPINPSTAMATPNLICPGDSSLLNATGCSGGSVEWYLSSQGLGAPLTDLNVKPTVNTNYYAYCISAAGCKSGFGTTASVMIDSCNTTTVFGELLPNLKVYPNPINNIVNIDLNQSSLDESLVFTVYNSLGKIVKSGVHKSGQKFSIDLSEYNKGFFILNISSVFNNRNKVVRLLKL